MPETTPVQPAAASAADRAIAVTIDDLPGVRAYNPPRRTQIFGGLMEHLAAHNAPATGFVNEGGLGDPPAQDRIDLLEAWLDAGFDLGNHTFSHPSLFDTPLAEYQRDVARGEIITQRLLATRGDSIRYFRHPYLNTGPDLATKTAFEDYLAERGYTVAPVTFDNDEFIYALAYDHAKDSDDAVLASRIAEDYLRYMDEMTVFYEQLARDVLGREPTQILLIHANMLNAEYLGILLDRLKTRGYRFVSLNEALQDSAYARPDQYAGESGLSWLHRWAITQGQEQRTEPSVPEWVRKTAYPN